MATKAASKRLSKEYVAMQKEPPPFVWAAPDEKNILTWNYLVRGPPDSPFSGGEYHGVILFPPEYPFKPPGIKMLTPSGRFQPDRRICFSMSDFHPGSWNPAWSVATILTGILSFMLSDEMTTGSVTTTEAEKRLLASRSHAWNLTQKRFRDAFPEYCTEQMRELPNMGESVRGSASNSESTSTNPSTTTTPAPSTPTTPAPVLPLVPQQPQVPSSNSNSNRVDSENKELKKRNENWVGNLRQLVWEKWRWGLFIALAVLVSRLSSAP